MYDQLPSSRNQPKLLKRKPEEADQTFTSFHQISEDINPKFSQTTRHNGFGSGAQKHQHIYSFLKSAFDQKTRGGLDEISPQNFLTNDNFWPGNQNSTSSSRQDQYKQAFRPSSISNTDMESSYYGNYETPTNLHNSMLQGSKIPMPTDFRTYQPQDVSMLKVG